MSLQMEKLEHNMAKITIEVPVEEMAKAVNAAYLKNKNQISIPGFRKGKVPLAMVEKMYGKGVFLEDAANAVIPGAYDKAVKECEEEIVSTPTIDVVQLEPEKAFIFTAEVALKPEVELGKYKGVKIDKIETEVTEDEVNEAIDRERKNNAREITVEDRPIQDGDKATIDFEGFVDGVAFEGGKGTNYDLVIGSHSFIDNFEEQLIGKNIGDEVEVNVTFPESYQAEELAGKPAVFKVKVNGIKVDELPELDDEFAKDISEFDTLDALKADIRAKLEEQAAKTEKQERENAVVDKLVADTEIDVPDCMIDNRVDGIIRENNMRMAQQGLSFEQYLSYMGSTIDQFKEMMRPNAEKQVKANLILEAIVKAENFEITDEMLDEKIKEMAEAYHMEADKLKSMFQGNEAENLKDDMKMEKAVAFLVENAKWAKPKKTASKSTASKTTKSASKTTTKKKTETKKAEKAEKAEVDE